MEPKNFTNIVGEAKSGEVANIRFFGGVTKESAIQFNNEFDWLEKCIKPSKIRVLINCEGGSVLHGMSVYSTIQNSTIPTECIIEGLAASMGSVIWAAGNKPLMRDYAILMIHNPFNPNAEDAESSDIVKAFTQQIETIYTKRFGLTKPHVKNIMCGEAGKDGTYFTAQEAVKAGIIPEENIIKTSKHAREKVQSMLEGISDAAQIQNAFEEVGAEILGEVDEMQNKPSEAVEANLNQSETPTKETENTNINNKQMNEKNNFEMIAAAIGLAEGGSITDVIAKLNQLKNASAELTQVKADLADAQTVIAGKEATITNIQSQLDNVQAELRVFKDKEEADRKAKVEAMVQAAVDAGKISSESKAGWIQMAESNLQLAEETLASIPAREVITEVIASDEDAANQAKGAVKTVGEQVEAALEKVLGHKFEFKKLQ